MCGIAGVFDTKGNRKLNSSLLEAMNRIQFHRGPDEGGTFVDVGIGLAHRRLSIIDRSGGQQPMVTPDNQVALVFNGEIYNFQEIKAELESKGYNFATNSDTEVILNGWLFWGEKVVTKLRGMFAFAIWDKHLGCLFLARDRLGIKPLHYALLSSGDLVFGSELKALQVHPELTNELSPEAIEDYFALGYIPEPKTIFKNVFKLSPGFTLTVSKGSHSLSPQQYWDLSFKQQTRTPGIEKELIKRLREAVEIRMISEVPLGAFLSGGVDSSAVVSQMAISQEKPVNTCAIGFKVVDFNETQFAALVAEKYNTVHTERLVAADDFSLLDDLAYIYDEPFADSSAIPTYRVCELAKEKVTVALSGDGGDEVFAGYRRYLWHEREEKVRRLIPAKIRSSLFGWLGKVYPKLDWAPKFLRGKSTFQAIARDTVEGYFHNFSILTEEQREQLFSPALKEKLNGYQAISTFYQYAEQFDGQDSISLVQYLDIKTYLPGDILTKVDRVSMAHALEVRVPLLDHHFVEWAAGIPANQKLVKSNGKHIFKKALEGYLPDDVLYRKKMGFSVPLAKWFRGPLKTKLREHLLEGLLSESELFNQAYVTQLVEQHQSGLRDNSAALWCLLMFESFLKKQAGLTRKGASYANSACS